MAGGGVETPRQAADRARAELASLIDRQMSPLGLPALDALAPARGGRVLDVGCGAGETLMQLAYWVGSLGQVVGVDVGPRVLAVARARTARLSHVTVVRRDASKLTTSTGCFDAIYSRFGIMFFRSPVRAFTGLRRLLRPDGRIGFVCWRPWRENELDRLPVEAAGLTAMVDETPFSFDRPDVIGGVLRSAGFTDVVVEPFDADVSSGGVDAMLEVALRVGALGSILRRMPVPGAESNVRAALAEREREGRVGLRAATWIVTATNR